MAYGRGFHGTACTIYDLSYLEMTLNVDELDISDVEVGQTVTITADAVEDTVYTGVVTNVSVAGNTSGGIATYPVTIRIDETDGLRPGMNVDAEIVISSAEDVLAVPSGAVNRGGTVMITADSPSAASAPDQEAPEGCVYVQVETGISDDSYTQISKGEFVAIVGPGNGIQGCIEDSFANMGTDSLTVAVMGRDSSRSVSEEEMYQLVSDDQDMLKQLSPMVSVSFPLQIGSFDISGAVAEAAESFRDYAAGGHALEVDVAPGLSYCGDEYAVRQLVSILLDNAVKYTASGGEICLSLERGKKGVILKTTNPCAGLSKAALDWLFGRFYRPDPSRSKQTGGFGVGLSIAKSMAEAHKGSIRAESPSQDMIQFIAVLR